MTNDGLAFPHKFNRKPPLTDARCKVLLEQIQAVTFMATFDSETKEQEIYVSPQIEQLLGYTQEEWTSDPKLWNSSLHPADRDRWDAEFARTLFTGESVRAAYRFLHKSGRTVWILGDVRIQRDAMGVPQYVQGVGFDITAQKETEEALRRRTEELEAAKEELRLAKERELAVKQREVDRVRSGFEKNRASETMIGASDAMRRLQEEIARYAPSDLPVLVTGESGTGKELVSQALHYSSLRASKPLVELNCAALTETLLQSELFGHKKGAFTGAVDDRVGKFQQADGGTLFLDEIGDMPLSTQAMILRVIEGHPFVRLGDNTPIRVDVRVICATNLRLEDLVATDKFRKDLYYRINHLQIAVPPLRARQGDILELADHFLAQENRRQKRAAVLSDAARHALRGCAWPGNIRQLKSEIGRAVIWSRADLILPDDLTPEVAGLKPEAPAPGKQPAFYEIIKGREIELIVGALKDAQGVKAKAARTLSLSINTFTDKMTQYGISALKEAPWVKVL